MTNEHATIFKNNPLGQFNGQGTGGKKSKDVFVGLIDRLTENGQINQEQIITYCKEENISSDTVANLSFNWRSRSRPMLGSRSATSFR